MYTTSARWWIVCANLLQSFLRSIRIDRDAAILREGVEKGRSSGASSVGLKCSHRDFGGRGQGNQARLTSFTLLACTVMADKHSSGTLWTWHSKIGFDSNEWK